MSIVSQRTGVRHEQHRKHPSVEPKRKYGRIGNPSYVLALAACLLIAVGVSVWMSGNGDAGYDLIVLAPVEQRGSNEPMMPFTFEAEADVVAIAVMGKSQSRGSQRVIRMELAEVLKGEQQLGPLESADDVVPFGCIMPENPQRFSHMYREGERVAVYLQKHDKGWTTLQMNHLTAEYEPQWKTRVQSFLDVLLASESDDPDQRYVDLLTPKARSLKALGSTTQLTEASYFALHFNPDPRAADPLRKMLLTSIEPKKQLSQDQQGFALKSHLRLATTFRGTPFEFVTLLAKMHDAESIGPVMDHIARLNNAQRVPFLQQLPELCRDADAATLQEVQAELEKHADDFRGDKHHPYRQTLDRVRASIDELFED